MAEEQPILYDTDASQRVPLKLEKRGRMYNVAHVFAPLIDEDVIEYERARDLRITEADNAETDDPDAVAVSSNSFNAAIQLWNHICLKIEGYKLKEGGDVESVDWRSLVNPADKAFAIDSALLGVAILPLPEAEAQHGYALDDVDDSSTIQLRALFNGHEMIATHLLRTPTPAEVSRYRGLMSRALLVRGTRGGQTDRRIPSRATGLAKLYDEMRISTSGYAGRVPIHHKTAVILHHLSAQQEVIAGN